MKWRHTRQGLTTYRFMMTILRAAALSFVAMACAAGVNAANYAWPANFQGVMLQGFYWDSYSGTNNSKWATLTSQSEELSQYFKVIWVPNSAKAATSPSMGYDPVYWFTHHTSSFGNEAQLRTMISTFKALGTDIIEDVVVNHRSGVTNWTNFPAETWNGVTYQLGPEHICKNDEVANVTGQAKPTGAYDTGENFDGSRDLDHTSTVVQDNIKAYTTFLLQDLGYSGFRYDMVKGYAGKYVGIYNNASKPKYSVGEYFDGSYDAVSAWIEATGKQSAAFDFPLKFALNDAFGSNDMSKLCWMENGTNPQPAGMIHHWYQQYAVTFVDNHDTYRDSWNKFNGNVVAANAFIICSPGTPCVFLPHWQAYKNEIKALIAARNGVGVHNQSAVKVLRHDRDCYMAEVTGSKGKLVVKIGNAQVSPEGYSNSQIKASGTGYCVWSTAEGSGTIAEPTYPANMYLIGHLPTGVWDTTKALKANTADKGVYTWSDVEIVESDDNAGKGFFSFITVTGSNWDAVNAYDRYGATSKDASLTIGKAHDVQQFFANADASSAYSWSVASGKYDVTLNLKYMTVKLEKSSDVEEIDTENTFTNAEYFTLQGAKVQNPENGIYIKIYRGKATKVKL